MARWCISAFERTSNQVATEAMLASFTPQSVQDARHELSAAGRQPSTVEIVRNICRQTNVGSGT